MSIQKEILTSSAKEVSNNIPIVSMPQINNQYINNCRIISALCSEENHLGSDCTLTLNTLLDINIIVRVKSYADTVTDVALTAVDRAVMDAVYTLHVYRCSVFTVDMLAKVIYGDDGMEVTDAKREMIRASIERLRNIGMYIDWTEEFLYREMSLAKRKHQEFDRSKYPPKIYFCTYMLPVENITLRTPYHKDPVKGYRLLDLPAMYVYASHIRQIINVPADMLRVPGVPNTCRAMLIKRHIIRHIAIISNPRNAGHSRKVSYGWSNKKSRTTRGLPASIGALHDDGTISRQEKSRIHHTVMAILDHYKAVGYIAGYTVETHGYGADNNPNTGVTVDPVKKR